MRAATIILAALLAAGCATDPRRTASMVDPTVASPSCIEARDAANAYRNHYGRAILNGMAWGLVPVVGQVVAIRADLEKRREKQRLNAAVEAACGTANGIPPIWQE